ncbi:MAG TPA: DMT family transporter [Bacteroidia bacterium]
MNDTKKAHLFLLTAQIIYALNFTIAKGLMPTFIGPAGLVFLRVSGACVLFWILSLFTEKEKVQKSHLIKFMILAVFGVACNQLCFIYGLHLSRPINSAIIMTINPILVTIFTLLVLKERFSFLKVIGLALGIGGALTLLLSDGKSFQINNQTALGDTFTLINACSWAVFVIMAKPYMQRYSTVTVMKWIFLFGFFLVLPFGLNDMRQVDFSMFTFHAWFALLFVIIGTTFLAYLFNTYALKYLSPSTVSAYIYLQPFLAITFALLLKKDELSVLKVIAGILIITGVYLAGRNVKRKN